MQTIDYIMIAVGYISGSIPWGQVIYFIMKRDDIRKHGSGNIGATNVMRTVGAKWGVVTFILDFLKGFLPVVACAWVGISTDTWTTAIVAVAAIVGHMFPVWLGFRGGKGVATAVGVFMGLNLPITIAAFGVFFIFVFATRIVSLSSLAGTATFVILAFSIGPWLGLPFSLRIAGLIAGALIFYKHRQNIVRLIRGEEKKLSSGKKQSGAGQ